MIRASVSALATVGGDVSVLDGLESAWFGAELIGRALTVRGAGGDNLALHRALAEAEPDQVLVVDVGGCRDAGHWGELMTIAAQRRGVAGLVMNGSIRDRAALARRAFPVFHSGTAPRPAAKKVPGEIGVVIVIEGVEIATGDLVAADDDGVIVVARAASEAVLEAAAALEQHEAEVAARLEEGETTMEALQL
jgi:4-hydroxy-4-methyl-2-oxoglutarate aldolase